jgi:hypothetical protein
MQRYNFDMYKFLTQRLVIAWIAMLSVLFGALAPAVSQAMVPVSVPGTEEVQICTMEGMKTIVIVDEDVGKRPAPSSDHMSKHCACCASHASIFMPPVVTFALPFLPRSSMRPPLFYQSATPLFAWITPAPRGPPASI